MNYLKNKRISLSNKMWRIAGYILLAIFQVALTVLLFDFFILSSLKFEYLAVNSNGQEYERDRGASLIVG